LRVNGSIHVCSDPGTHLRRGLESFVPRILGFADELLELRRRVEELELAVRALLRGASELRIVLGPGYVQLLLNPE